MIKLRLRLTDGTTTGVVKTRQSMKEFVADVEASGGILDITTGSFIPYHAIVMFEAVE